MSPVNEALELKARCAPPPPSSNRETPASPLGPPIQRVPLESPHSLMPGVDAFGAIVQWCGVVGEGYRRSAPNRLQTLSQDAAARTVRAAPLQPK